MSSDRQSLIQARSVAVRALASGRVHRADVAPRDLVEATHWGAPCTLVNLDSVACLCGVVLSRRQVIRIPEGEKLDSWRRNRGVCKACERIEMLR